jgi:glutamate synthase domain-containing protein 3
MVSIELRDFYYNNLRNWSLETLQDVSQKLVEQAKDKDISKTRAIEILTYLNDIHIPPGNKKRSTVLRIVRESLTDIFSTTPKLGSDIQSSYKYIDWTNRALLRAPQGVEKILVVNAQEFPPEGEDCDARLIVSAFKLGWKRFIAYGYKGQRFCGCGLSADSDDVRIDVYDSSGDYLASGIDGLEIHVHGNAQDQVGQIMKRGKLVIYGDVGQTFMYGAKGGEVYVMGNAAGRPLINAVGKPRVVINGTCLDYLAESFMAGDPLNGGGFVIMNGISFDRDGKIFVQDTPYPGSNLFSLASGGAIYLRDPEKKVVSEQLNGGECVAMTPADWDLILPYLKENERLFGIRVDDLLSIDGVKHDYSNVYRKVQVVKLDVLSAKAQSSQSARQSKVITQVGK